MKKFLVILFVVLALSILLLAMDSLLQPKVRVVPLEDVALTAGAPDVTFMIGASMDPPVLTNPFLVIFSPLERMTDQAQVVSGSLTAVSDSASVFVWEAFGIRSSWHLDRTTLHLTPSADTLGSGKLHICTRTFPTLASALRSRRN